jgi:hypothetical protein
MIDVKPYYNVKCAGMPDKSKNLFIQSMNRRCIKGNKGYTKEEFMFLAKHRELEDFKIGLRVSGKLTPKRVKGGIILIDTTYEMR